MDFLSSIKNREELVRLLNVAIDRIYKQEPKKTGTDKVDPISKVFMEYCSNQLTKSELLEYFPVQDDLKDCVLKTIELRKPQVCEHLVRVHNSSNIPLLKSFDWDLKFIIGNSSLSSFREQQATLIFNCQNNGNDDNISVEIDGAKLDELILKLEESISN